MELIGLIVEARTINQKLKPDLQKAYSILLTVFIDKSARIEVLTKVEILSTVE